MLTVWLLITLAGGVRPPASTFAPYSVVPNAMARTYLDGFDDFNEASRRVLFYARAAVSESGGAAITPDHLMLGILRGTPDVVRRFLQSSDSSTDAVTQQVLTALGTAVRVDESVEIPISPEAEHVLASAVGRARATTARTVRPEHILLALLETSHTKVADVLRSHGITAEAVAADVR